MGSSVLCENPNVHASVAADSGRAWHGRARAQALATTHTANVAAICNTLTATLSFALGSHQALSS